ncbi:NlpD Membrane proteins related to metalloendopeptidases [Candidatus Pelagibacterales bacterium]|jgi:murein DD-endopeptidase MepM/ murein hydrolase activator NlpD
MYKKILSYRPSFKPSLVFLIIPVLIIFIFISKSFDQYSENGESKDQELENNLITVKDFLFNQFNSGATKVEHKVRNGDSIQRILYDQKISPSEVNNVLNALRREYNFGTLRNDQKVYLIVKREKNGNFVSRLTVNIDNITSVHVFLNKDNVYETKRVTKILTKKNHLIETTIDRGIYRTAKQSGIENSIVAQFARLYGFEVDFQRDLKKNDKIKIFYERYLDDDGVSQRTGNIIYSEITNVEKNIILYRYEYPNGTIAYFTPEGKSIEKSLMRTPINGAKLSSRYGFRIHPILGYNQMHQGTDFAAPIGTPVMASGAGTVEYSGWKGGYGKFISIRHSPVYQTNYAHLQDYAKGIRRGAKVQQGQVIGYLGSTGSSTGPHLHYEVVVNGRKENSQTLKLPSAAPLEGNNKNFFEIQKRNIDNLILEASKKK